MNCYSCNQLVEIQDTVGRQDTCPQCNAYLHCCRNCRFYDPTAYNECHETMADRVTDKVVANFCDYFGPSDASSKKSADSKADPKKALEALFNKK